MKIEWTHVDWWMGYDTLIVADTPSRPSESQVQQAQRWVANNKPTCYVPAPFEEFLWLSPWRQYPHERWELMAASEDFAGKKVLDIGASIGYFSFLAAAAGAEKVVALETYEKARELMSKLVKLYGFDNVEVVNKKFGPRDPLLRKPDIVIALSVLPYLGKYDPEPLKRTLRALARQVPVSFIEMGDGGSELSWCIGDTAFRELFQEAGFSKVEALGTLLSSHTNTQRTLWRCDG